MSRFSTFSSDSSVAVFKEKSAGKGAEFVECLGRRPVSVQCMCGQKVVFLF